MSADQGRESVVGILHDGHKAEVDREFDGRCFDLWGSGDFRLPCRLGFAQNMRRAFCCPLLFGRGLVCFVGEKSRGDTFA